MDNEITISYEYGIFSVSKMEPEDTLPKVLTDFFDKERQDGFAGLDPIKEITIRPGID